MAGPKLEPCIILQFILREVERELEKKVE